RVSTGPETSSPCWPFSHSWGRSRSSSSASCGAGGAIPSPPRRRPREVHPLVCALLVELRRRRRLAGRSRAGGRAGLDLPPHPQRSQRLVAAPGRDRAAPRRLALARDAQRPLDALGRLDPSGLYRLGQGVVISLVEVGVRGREGGDRAVEAVALP